MITFTAANGQGVRTHAKSIRDTQGTSMVPVQVEVVSGTPTFRLVGRVHPDAAWREIKAADTVGFLETVAWVPFIGVEVTAGVGEVRCWIGEK